jgi:hypothetical protein
MTKTPTAGHHSPPRRGFSLADLALALLCVAVALAITLPTIARGLATSRIGASLDNLVELGVAHAIYAAEWDGRQVSVIDDDMTMYGASAASAFQTFQAIHDEPHPPLVLGWGLHDDVLPVLYAYRQSAGFGGNHGLVQPITFDGFTQYFGFFRLANTRPFHDYVSGRFYDPTFYPASDRVVHEVVAPAFDSPWEFVNDLVDSPLGDIPAWSSYCLSPAALFHPDVMRAPADGGWQDPWGLPHAFNTPGLYDAEYPSLKTHMLEHHWLQDPLADPCNPWFPHGTYAGCEPYYFNHALASAPATLFYDLSTRLLPNSEVIAADAKVMMQTGDGLWSRDTPFGANGYLGEYAYDGTIVSHHILTTGGIDGRDTVAAPAGLGLGLGPGPRR